MKLTCFRISNGALAGEKLPERIKILNWGDNPNIKGCPVRVTERTLSSIPALNKAKGFDRCALDYEHNTVPESAEFKRTQEPRKVAGYGCVSVVAGEGMYLENMVYTPSGIENAREYIDLSPAVHLDEATGEVLWVHSAALCRQGAVEDLHFFNIEIGESQEGNTEMDEIKEQLAALSAALDALSKRVAEMDKPEAVEALSAKTTELEGQLKTFKADLDAENARREKEMLIQLAARDGKVVALSAEAIAKLSVDELKDHIGKVKPSVPLTALSAGGAYMTEDQILQSGLREIIAKNCGLDPAKVK